SAGMGLREGRATYQAPPDTTEVTVEVTGAQAADGSPLPLGPAKVGPVRMDAGEVEVRLPPEKAITGFVKGPDGKGVRGVLVTAVAAGNEGQARYGSSGNPSRSRTDADGAFRVGGLGADDVSLLAQAPPEFAPTEPVRSRGGAIGVEIVLRQGAAAVVTVLDWQGKPVAGASVN